MTAPLSTATSTSNPTSSVPAGSRPPTASAPAATLVFAWRRVLQIRHVPEQVFDIIAIPVVFTLMFTYLFGGALAGSTSTYLQTLLPGTLVMTVLLLTTFTGSALVNDRSSGVLDRFRSLPVWRPAPLVGSLIGDVGRYVLASSLVLVLGLVMGFRPDGGLLGVLAAFGLTVAFAHGVAWIWVVVGLLARTATTVTTASFGVLFPATLASNTFVDPATLPSWLRAVVDANPISHLVTASRALMHGEVPAGEIGLVLGAAATLTLVFGSLALHLDRTRT